MIVTVTPNPSVDRTLEVDELGRGEVVRTRASRDDAGGKGVNVATALLAAGVPTSCILPLGGNEGTRLRELIARAALDVVAVPVAGDTRVNLSLTEPDGTVTKVNAPGPELDADEIEALLAAVATAAADAAWVVAAGSLPPGAPIDLHARVVELAHEAGARAAVDTAGPALLAALEAAPDLVKPNQHELSLATGATITTTADALSAAAVLRSRGAATVLASLGEDGALLVDDHAPLHAVASVARPRSTVGAGDATLAGYLVGVTRGESRDDALRRAVAYGAAAVALPGTRMPLPGDLDLGAVRVSAPSDHARRAATSATTLVHGDDSTNRSKGEPR